MNTRPKQKPSDSSQHETSKADLILQIQAAEALRVEKQYLQAFSMFSAVIDVAEGQKPLGRSRFEQGKDKSQKVGELHLSAGQVMLDLAQVVAMVAWFLDGKVQPRRAGAAPKFLTHEQLNWTRAHAAAAAINAYKTNSGMEWLLHEARALLFNALRSVEKFSEHDAWAWAQLGEVYRKIGNLPAFYYEFDQLFVRNGFIYYQMSALGFLMALTLDPGSAWAKAHFGAMILNRRRYYRTWKSSVDETSYAFRKIRAAVIQQQHRANWSTDYVSIAHFVRAIYRLLSPDFNPAAQLKAEKVSLEDSTHFRRALKRTIDNFKKLLRKSSKTPDGSLKPDVYKKDIERGTAGKPPTGSTVVGEGWVLQELASALKMKSIDSDQLWEAIGVSALWPVNSSRRNALQGSDGKLVVKNLKILAQDIFISLYYSIVLWNNSPNLVQHPVQPGAMEFDATYAVLYDLSVLLPYATEEVKKAIIDTMIKLAEIGVALPKREQNLPYVLDIGQLYFVVYIRYFAGVGDESSVEDFQLGSAPAVKLLPAANQMCDLATRILNLQSSATSREGFSGGTQNEVRLSAISVMLNLLKTCVILRLRFPDAKSVEWGDAQELQKKILDVLKDYNDRLDFFSENNTAETVVEALYQMTITHEHAGKKMEEGSSSADQPMEDARNLYKHRKFWVLEPSWYFGELEITEFFFEGLRSVLNFQADWRPFVLKQKSKSDKQRSK